MRVFVCFAPNDQAFAFALIAHLQSAHLEVILPERDSRHNLLEHPQESLAVDAFILIISKIAATSPYLRRLAKVYSDRARADSQLMFLPLFLSEYSYQHAWTHIRGFRSLVYDGSDETLIAQTSYMLSLSDTIAASASGVEDTFSIGTMPAVIDTPTAPFAANARYFDSAVTPDFVRKRRGTAPLVIALDIFRIAITVISICCTLFVLATRLPAFTSTPTQAAISQPVATATVAVNPGLQVTVIASQAPSPSSQSTYQPTVTGDSTPIVSLVTATPIGIPGTATPLPSATQKPNLLINGDFETGNLSGWDCDNADAVVPMPVNSGSYALHIVPTVNTTGRCIQQVTVTTNHTYKLQAMISGQSAFMEVKNIGTTAAHSSSYQQFTYTFSSGSAVSVFIEFYGVVNQTGFYIDDVSLR